MKKKEIIPEVMEPEMADDENEEFDEDYDPVEDLPAPQRRRVLAIKDIQAQYDEVSTTTHRFISSTVLYYCVEELQLTQW